MSEAKIEAKISKYLKSIGGYFFKVMMSSRKGTHDRVGLIPVVITEAMVGQKIGVFCSFEIKNEDGGDVSKLQLYHEKKIKQAGGLSGVVNSVEEVKQILALDDSGPAVITSES
jgi:hypothetical protein